jgi:hypothetical protein
MIRKLSIAMIATLAGCSWWQSEPPPAAGSDVSFDLYLSRASLNGAEFEQYKLLPIGVFAECGTLHRGRQESRVQSIYPVDDATRAALRNTASKIFLRMQRQPAPSLDAPGDNANPFDPGKYLLTVKSGSLKIDAKTSLDSVVHPNSVTQELLQQLAALSRGSVDGTPCGNAEFYGLAKSKP